MAAMARAATMARLDRAAAGAWPAATAVRAGGWLLRSTPGQSGRRANSALPEGPAPLELAEVERFYRRLGRPGLVQVSPAELHGALDAELAGRGWTAEGPTEVHSAPVDLVLARTGPPAGFVVGLAARAGPVWLAAKAAAGAGGAPAVLARVPAPAAYLTARRGGRTAGVALAAADPAAAVAGLFCLATAPAARRTGIATALLHAAAAWAAAGGARLLYVQVEAGNAAALGLYRRVGFARAYGYHYRRADLH